MRLGPVVAIVFGLCLVASRLAVAQPLVVDEPAVCFACHSEMEVMVGKEHVHTAFENDKCSTCHNPHAARHASLLTAESGEQCLACHEDVQAELQGMSSHAPARQGACTSCHDPHASAFPNQLKKEEASLCRDCHAPVEEWFASPVVHDPVADGDCLDCHEHHGSSVGQLLDQGVPGLCFDCHDADAAFDTAHRGRNIRESDCTACHDPHSGPLPGLLRKNQHAPFESGDCQRCHGSQDAGGTFAMEGDVKSLCIECHRGLEEFEQADFHSHIDGNKSCLSCHNPHASNAEALLAAEQKVVCMKCHFNEEGRKEKAAYLTHDGMDCTNCHSVHGADNPTYLVSLEVDLCADCHGSAHRVSHPVGPEVVDKRTGKSVTCLSCHKMHGGDYENYLKLDPVMDLCIQCHQR